MKIALIGRSEYLIETAKLLLKESHKIVLIITAKEAPEYKASAKDFKLLSEELKIPFQIGSKIINFKNLIKTCNPQIGISLNYTGIIPQEIIDIFPFGILNAHGGDLPKYKGNACQAWAIINGEKEIGLCIHKMIGDELDSGDIISRKFFQINDETKITDYLNWSRKVIPNMFKSSINKLNKNPKYILESQSKNPLDSLRCFPRCPEDGLINWKNDALNILRLINASAKPYAGAFCFFKNKKLIIWEAKLCKKDFNYLAIPGQIILVKDEYVDVACYKSQLRIFTIEIDEYIGPPSKFINSIRIRLK